MPSTLYSPVKSQPISPKPLRFCRSTIRKNNLLCLQQFRDPFGSAHSKATSTRLDSALADTLPLTILRMETYKRVGGGRGGVVMVNWKSSASRGSEASRGISPRSRESCALRCVVIHFDRKFALGLLRHQVGTNERIQ